MNEFDDEIYFSRLNVVVNKIIVQKFLCILPYKYVPILLIGFGEGEEQICYIYIHILPK